MPNYITAHLNYLCESHLAISEHGISKSAYYCIMAPCVSHPTELVIQPLKICISLQKLHKMG